MAAKKTSAERARLDRLQKVQRNHPLGPLVGLLADLQLDLQLDLLVGPLADRRGDLHQALHLNLS